MDTSKVLNEKEHTPRSRGIVLGFLRVLGQRLGLVSVLLVGLLTETSTVRAATISVDTTDETSSATQCSLRQAIRAANTNTAVGGCVAGDAGMDTIVLPSGLYTLTLAGPNEDDALTGDLDIHEDLEIAGADRTATVIDGARLDRVFEIMPGVVVTFTNLTIQNGQVMANGETNPAVAGGGAIYSAGALTLRATSLISNRALDSTTTSSMGGALYSTAPLDLTDVLFQDNQAQLGGAVYAANTQTAIINGRFVENEAEKGGALYLDAQSVTTISASQILSNSAIAEHTDGGGIANAGVLTLTGSLVAYNRAFPSGQFANPDGRGGGVYNVGSLVVQQSRIADNSASDQGGGVYGGATYRDVTIATNTAGRQGGGLYGLGNLTNVTLSDNTVGEFGIGAGGYGCGALRNVTISNNHTGGLGRGGGLGFDQAEAGIVLIGRCMTLQHVTVIINSAPSGAGLLVLTSSRVGLMIENTVIVHNEGRNSCRLSDATVQSMGGNYVDDLSCEVTAPTDRQGELPDPLLGPLADNGGMTQTHMPQAGSPLIDSGSCNGSIVTDQRDEPRPQGYGCDIGAVEAPGLLLRFLPVIGK